MDEMKQQDVIAEEGITFSELLKIVWSNITLVFLITLWVTVIGVVYTFVIVNPEYTAETSIMIQIDTDTTDLTDQQAVTLAQQLIVTYKEFAVSDLVLESVLEDIPTLDYSYAKLREAITLSSTTSSVIVTIEVVDESPEMAQEIANQLVVNSIEIANDYMFLKDRIKQMLPAVAPNVNNPSAPNKVLNIVISFLIGIVLSLGIVFVKELFNNKFKSTAEMEKYLNINVIAAVPGTIKERKLVD
ncbi:MAG: Wzz/FepE/Etk N-terminal domain-containing protein [Candidatus Izemoplasmatales bacterium]|jgi:capsular polysaccharide biosynthesis protein|nr:Wzz/FepE/Etk N-terminal domain-containing protein [Candidatus Izemoplasmatales bacterium]MDD3864990.1 Wzz/FepE/Etk N-terminal domain-containing protein [Candidatus Izemoplasmatales bacterium]